MCGIMIITTADERQTTHFRGVCGLAVVVIYSSIHEKYEQVSL